MTGSSLCASISAYVAHAVAPSWAQLVACSASIDSTCTALSWVVCLSGFIDYTACASLTKKFKKAISNDLECWGICGITYDTTYIDRRDAAVELGWAWVSLTLIMTMGLHVGRKDVCIMHPLSYPHFREPYSLLVRVFRTFTRISNYMYQFLVNFWLVATTYLPCYSNQQGKPPLNNDGLHFYVSRPRIGNDDEKQSYLSSGRTTKGLVSKDQLEIKGSRGNETNMIVQPDRMPTMTTLVQWLSILLHQQATYRK